MTATLTNELIVPPPAEWAVQEAAWAESGRELRSAKNQYGYLLTSPPLTLQSGRACEFALTLDFLEPGGVTFGLQDAEGKSWLQQTSQQGKGTLTLRLKVPSENEKACRLVLANCRFEKPAVTRMANLSIEVNYVELSRLSELERAASASKQAAKDEIRKQWNTDHCGGERGGELEKGSLDWFLAIEKDRYGNYAPWMKEAIGFEKYAGKKVLEVGGGLGTDHAQFAKAGAIMTDYDLAEGHLNMARRNFEVRGLKGEFVLGDAEQLPFPDASFDAVYSFGVIHHTPGTEKVVEHIHRVLKPGGEAIIMVYAKHSWNYWHKDVYELWWKQGLRKTMTMAEILSANTEHSPNGARPLVKVYTAAQCRNLFRNFGRVRVRKYQLTPGEVPRWMLKLASIETWGRLMGWNLLINAVK